MRKFLVPLDGSDCANRALAQAIAVAQAIQGAKLVLLNVHPEPVVYGEIQVYVPVERMQELQDRHSRDIFRPATGKLEAAGVSHSLKVAIGDPASLIAKTAADLGCDGIIMGTRGMSSIGNLLLGSIASKVVHLAEVPVTLVK